MTGHPATRLEARTAPGVRSLAKRRSRYAGHRWFAAAALVVLVASDYKFRVRDPNQTLNDAVDIAILLEIVAYTAVGVYLAASRPFRPRIPRLPLPLGIAAALVALMILSIPRSTQLSVEVIRGFQMVVVLGLATALARRGSRIDVHVFLHGFLALVTASVVFGVVFPMPRLATQPDRFTWLRIHPVVSGVFVAIATLLAAGYLIHRRTARPGPHWPTWIYGICGVIVAGGLYATKTRGAVLGTLVALLVLAWMSTKGRQRLETMLAIVLAIVAIVLATSSQLLAYLQRGETADQLATLNSRTQLWDVAWAFVREKPLYGYGIGASHSLFLDSTGLGGAHNALVNVLIDLGIVGTLVWAALIVTVVVTTVRHRSADPGVRLDRGLLVSLMTLLLVNGVSNGGLGDEANVSSTFLFVLTAWCCLIARTTPLPRRRRRVALVG